MNIYSKQGKIYRDHEGHEHGPFESYDEAVKFNPEGVKPVKRRGRKKKR